MIKHNPPSPEPLHRAIARFGDVAVLVVGDFILDRFVNGVIERISPEAPIPVLHGRGETAAMGGAGNVIANIVSLGASAIPVSAIGADTAGNTLVRMLGELGVDTSGLAQDGDRMTSSKSRFSALNQQVLRFDEEEIKPLGDAERETPGVNQHRHVGPFPRGKRSRLAHSLDDLRVG